MKVQVRIIFDSASPGFVVTKQKLRVLEIIKLFACLTYLVIGYMGFVVV